MKIPIDDAFERIGQGPFQRRILVAAGLCFAADSMEILLMSFLVVVLQSQWGLSEHQTSFMTSSVFLGAMFGTLVLGPLGDKLGRKPVFTLTAGIIASFGLLTSLCNGFYSLLLCRFLVGFGVGGLTVPFDTLAEFIPSSVRGKVLLQVNYFWTGGTLLVPILAFCSLDLIGGSGVNEWDWRVFVLLCAVPCIISTLMGYIVVPESPRWLVQQGRNQEALDILREAAKVNNINPDQAFPEGSEILDDGESESHNFLDLLKPRLRSTTLTLWATWAGFAFTYYGTILIVTLAFSGKTEAEFEEDFVDDDQVEIGAYSFRYGAIFTSASSEIAGVLMAILMVDRFGRVPAQAVSFVLGGASILLFCLSVARGTVPHYLLVTLSFLARMFFMGGSCSTWVSTAEILSTDIRTTGHAAANAIARLGGSISPFLIRESVGFSTIGVTMLIVSILTALSARSLPETRGLKMGEACAIHSDGEDDGKTEEDTNQYQVL